MNKPKCQLIGQDGNAFYIVGKAVRTLKKAGMNKEADELSQNYSKCESYNELLCLVEKICRNCLNIILDEIKDGKILD